MKDFFIGFIAGLFLSLIISSWVIRKNFEHQNEASKVSDNEQSQEQWITCDTISAEYIDTFINIETEGYKYYRIVIGCE